MLRTAVALALAVGSMLTAQDVRSFKQLSSTSPGCPRTDHGSAGAHRMAADRPLMDSAKDEVIALGARRSVADFGVTDLEGHLQTVGELKGQIVAIGFWSTRCDPSTRMLQEFRNFQKQAKQHSMKLVLWPVHFEPWPEVLSFLRTRDRFFEGVTVKRLGLGEHGLSQLVDTLDSLPTVFLVDKHGNLASTWSGYQENLLLKRINGLIAER